MTLLADLKTSMKELSGKDSNGPLTPNSDQDTIDESYPEDYYHNPQYHSDKPYVVTLYLTLSNYAWQIVKTSNYFNYFMILVIIFAGIMVGVESYQGLNQEIITAIDSTILSLFGLEVILKVVMEGLRPWRYFTGHEWRWNIFDLLIVIFSLPIGLFTTSSNASITFLRLIRLARIGKLVKKIPAFQVILYGLFDGMNSIIPILVLLLLVFFIYGIVGFHFFGENDPFHFGTLGISLVTLLRISLYENSGDIMYINTFGCNQYDDGIYVNPHIGNNNITVNSLFWCTKPQSNYIVAPIYFISFLILAAFVVMSLFVGAISMSMSQSIETIDKTQREKRRKKIFTHNLNKLYSLKTYKSSRKSLAEFSQKDIEILTLYEKCLVWIAYISHVLNTRIIDNQDLDMAIRRATLSTSLSIAMGWNESEKQFYLYDNQMSPNQSRHPSSSSSPHKSDKKKNSDSFMNRDMNDYHSNNTSHKSNKVSQLLGNTDESYNYLEHWLPRTYLWITVTCYEIVHHSYFIYLQIVLVVITMVNVGFETDKSYMKDPTHVVTVKCIEYIVLAGFTLEIVLKILSHGLKPFAYFRKLWNIFDTIIVIGAYIPQTRHTVILLRIFRLQRILKVIKCFPSLLVIINALFESTFSIGYLIIVLFVFFYMYAILGMTLFASNDPWHFGTLHISFITLFRAITYDNTFEVMYINQYGCNVYKDIYASFPNLCLTPQASKWLAVIYIIIFVLVGGQILLTLFIGIISSGLDASYNHKRREIKLENDLAKRASKLQLSKDRVDAFKRVYAILDLDEGGCIEQDELKFGLSAINLSISDALMDEYLDIVDPHRDGIHLIGFIDFMSLLPSYKKSIGEILSNFIKNTTTTTTHSQSIIGRIIHTFYQLIGYDEVQIFALQTEAALTIQEYWKDYQIRRSMKFKSHHTKSNSNNNSSNTSTNKHHNKYEQQKQNERYIMNMRRQSAVAVSQFSRDIEKRLLELNRQQLQQDGNTAPTSTTTTTNSPNHHNDEISSNSHHKDGGKKKVAYALNEQEDDDNDNDNRHIYHELLTTARKLSITDSNIPTNHHSSNSNQILVDDKPETLTMNHHDDDDGGGGDNTSMQSRSSPMSDILLHSQSRQQSTWSHRNSHGTTHSQLSTGNDSRRSSSRVGSSRASSHHEHRFSFSIVSPSARSNHSQVSPSARSNHSQVSPSARSNHSQASQANPSARSSHSLTYQERIEHEKQIETAESSCSTARTR